MEESASIENIRKQLRLTSQIAIENREVIALTKNKQDKILKQLEKIEGKIDKILLLLERQEEARKDKKQDSGSL